MIASRSPWIPFLAALLVYGRAVMGTFHFDDYALLVDPAVTAPGGWLDCFRLEQTRPLTWLSYWANYQLGGAVAVGYLAVNVLLHAVNSWLLTQTMRRVVPPNVAFVAALFFAVHPAALEPVNYIFARAILLATLFSLLAMRSWFGGNRWAAVAWFAAGMMAKEECAALPLFLCLFDVSRGWNRTVVAPLAAMLGVACAAGVRVLYVTKTVVGAGSGFGSAVTPFDYLSAQGWAILRYWRMMTVWPFGFSIDPDFGRLDFRMALLGWIVVLVIVVVAMFRFRNLRSGFWVIGSFLLFLPSSSILPASDFVADRRMYLPMIAVVVALAAIPRFSSGAGTALALSGIFAAISIWGTGFFSSEPSLWMRAVELAPAKARPKMQLARVSPPPTALRLLDEAQKIVPNDPAVASEKARVFVSMNKPELALAEFGRALALAPNDAMAIANRGSALALLGQTDAARLDFEQALRLDPCQFDARYNLKLLGIQADSPAGGCRWNQDQLQKLGAAL